MLSRNDQLVPEGVGRRQQSRGTHYVSDPPHGFFIAGSTVKQLNGVYVRKNAPRSLVRDDTMLLYYSHMTDGTLMILTETKRVAPPPVPPRARARRAPREYGDEYDDEEDDYDEDEDDDGEDEDDVYAQMAAAAKPSRQWLLVDEKGVDRFMHIGDTIVPGAGVRWKHVHKKSGGVAAARAAAAAARQFGAGGGAQLAAVAPDDQDELPW